MSFLNRRQDARQAHGGLALVLHAGAAIAVELIDLSPGGCCLRRPRGWNLNLGDTLSFHVASGPGPMSGVEAKVVWYMDDRIGLEFVV